MKRNAPISRSALALKGAAARLREVVGVFFLTALMGMFVVAGSAFAQTPIRLIVADFNHDGIPDVLSPSAQTSSLTIAFGSVPYGTFNPVAKNVPYPAACANVANNSVGVGDFNGDGIPDIVMACFGGQLQNTTLFVLLGNGDGTFSAGVQLPGAPNVVTGDFNHDGLIDIVTEGANATNQQILTFYAGKGDGTFAPGVSSTLANAFYSPMLAVDVNQDGYTDIVLGSFASQGANSVYVFGNNRDGTFGVVNATSIYGPNTSVGVGSYPAANESTILTGNFFGSGLPDLAVPDSGSNSGIYVLQNTSTGSSYSFAAAAKTSVAGLQGAVSGSFVKPGVSDLLVSNGTQLTVLANNGQGSFGSGVYSGLSVANTSLLYAAADANGDGYSDVYTAATTATGVNVTVNLVSGSASASSAPFSLPAGTVPVTAAWPGNVNFAGITANGSQIVNPIGSTVGLGSSLNPSVVGNNVTFTATVVGVGRGNPAPTGTVTFTDGSTTLGSSPVGQGGLATLSTSALTAGGHAIGAVYSGDSTFGGSSTTLTQQVNAGFLLTSFTPNTATLGDPNKTITVTGSGFTAATVAQLSGVAIATTVVNSTTLTAVIPAANMLTPATLQITLKDPATGAVTASLPFTVLNLPVGATLTGPATTPPGTQPTLNFTVPAYPVDLTATFTLAVKSGLSSGVTDPNVLFTNGSTTYGFVIKGGTTTVPTIQLQAGTEAATITIPVVLTTTGGTVVTPPNLVPVVIVVPPAVPTATASTLTRSGTQLTVVVTGYSNTRDVSQAHFHFVPAAGASLTTPDISADVSSVFTTYYANPANYPFGSTFVYTQVFTVNGDANDIGSVQVTLTNSVGVSVAVTAQ